jgi:hypothetical protein
MKYYRNEDETKYLGIYPPLGWINFKDSTIISNLRAIVTNVPNDEQVLQLGLEYLRKIGIDRSQLATKEGVSDLRIYRAKTTSGWFDEKTKKDVEQIVTRSVFFIRRVDGIDFSGIGSMGGVSLGFANNGRLTELSVVWRNLEPFKLYKTADTNQLLALAKKGQGKWVPAVPHLNEAKKITITSVQPLYRGAEGEEEQEIVEPYVLLGASLDFGTTNIVSNFECNMMAP